jgi:hypothetical protein
VIAGFKPDVIKRICKPEKILLKRFYRNGDLSAMVESTPVRFAFFQSRIVVYAIASLLLAAGVLIWLLPVSVAETAVCASLAAVVTLATLSGIVRGMIAVVIAAVAFAYLLEGSLPAGLAGFSLVALSAYGIERWAILSGRDQKVRLLLSHLRHSRPQNPDEADSRTRELGRLDGCHNGVLYGWALDANDETRASKLSLYVDGRPQAETLAVHYRPDVGSHCFYFDLESLNEPAREASVDVRFSDGRVVPNAPMTVRVPARLTRRKEAVLFMHISKTAGTAFREALAENYRLSEIAYVYPDAPGMLCRNLSDLPLEQRRGFRLVAGHFQYGIHNFFPQEYAYVTIVREPVARIISEHRYLREKGRGNTEQNAASSLIAMLENPEHVNLDNLLVRCFSGVNESELPPGSVNEKTYRLALENLRKGFCIVGHQERLQAAYETMRERFDWKPRGAFERVNATRVGTPEEYEGAREAIERSNRWDLELYAEILRLYPLG